MWETYVPLKKKCGGLSGGENYPGRSKGKRRAELGFGSSQKTHESLPSARSRIKPSIKTQSNSGVILLLPMPPCPPPNKEKKLPPPIGGATGEAGCGVPFEGPSSPLVGASEDSLKKPPRTFATLFAAFWSVFDTLVAAACKSGRASDTSPTVGRIVRPATRASGMTAEEADSIGTALADLFPRRGAERCSSVGDESTAGFSSGAAAGSELLSLGVTAPGVDTAGLEEGGGVEPTGGPGTESPGLGVGHGSSQAAGR
jgi:hypothetical protein